MRFLLLFCSFALVVSCQEGGNSQTPEYLLSEEQMVDVMVDMHLVETAHNLKLMGADSAYTEYLQKFNAIFESHGVTKAEYDSSLMYYTANTEQMPAIYDKILENLYELESQVKADQ